MQMLKQLYEMIPTGTVLFCAALSGLIPWTIYKINRKLHEHGDPPWKNGENGNN